MKQSTAHMGLRCFAMLTFCGLLLAGCSGTNLKLQQSEEAKPDQVVLGANGLPSLTDLMRAGPLGEKWQGRESAPVTVIEYISLTCPHCRAFHTQTYPRFKKAYIDTGKVRYIVREFPIGRSAGNASIVTRCGKKDRTFQLIGLFLKNQKQWVSQEVRPEAIFSVAKRAGLTRDEFNSCMKDQQLIDGLNWVKNRGRQLGVSGTPTFFINGEKVRKPLSFEELKAQIDPHLAKI